MYLLTTINNIYNALALLHYLLAGPTTAHSLSGQS